MGLFGKKDNPEKLYKKGSELYEKKKYAEALRLFEQAAQAEHNEALYMAALCYSRGSGTEKNMEIAAQRLSIAAQRGHAKSQFTLGMLYWNGDGVAKDEKQSFHWMNLAALQGDAAAFGNIAVQYELGIGTEQNDEKAREYHIKAYSAGDEKFVYNLGLMYLTGRGGEVDYDKAEKCLKVALARGEGNAEEWLNKLDELREEQAAGKVAALEQAASKVAALEQAAQSGDKKAQYELGMSYIVDCYYDEGENDYKNALYWLEKAAGQGNPQTQRDLVHVAACAYYYGFMDARHTILRLENSDIVKSYARTDMTEREKTFRGLDGRDFPLELSERDIHGKKVPFMVLDVIEALGEKYPIVISEQPWFTENSNETMAVMFRDPKDPFFNTADNVSKLKVMPDTGEWRVPIGLYEALRDTDGRRDLAFAHMYERGEMLCSEGNWIRGIALLQQAGEGGDANAQTKAAELLSSVLYQHSLRNDLKVAAFWYEKAASQGDARAQYIVGMQYKHGKGVKKNMDTAKEWLEMSAKQDYKNAVKALEIMGRDQVDALACSNPDPSVLKALINKYRSYASSGDGDAAYRLAVMYYKGEVVPRDYERAMLLLEESTNTDDPDVQYYLALIYYEGGDNVTRDVEEAKAYAARAAKQGHEGARALLDKWGVNK